MVFHLLVNNTPYPRNEKQPQGPRFVIRTFTILDSAQIGSKTGPNPRGDLRGCTSDPLEFSGLASPCLYPALKSTAPSARLQASLVLAYTPAQEGVYHLAVLGCYPAQKVGTQRATGLHGRNSTVSHTQLLSLPQFGQIVCTALLQALAPLLLTVLLHLGEQERLLLR